MSTPVSGLTCEQDARVRLHHSHSHARTWWWVSVDGRYLREDFPTKEAARRAALARLRTLDSPQGTSL